MDGKIVIITHQFSVVVKSMERGLSARGLDVVLIDDNVYEIKELESETKAFILYLQDSIIGNKDLTQSLFLLCDTFKGMGRSVILIGNGNYHRDFLDEVPALNDYVWIDRPVEIDKLLDVILNEKKIEDDIHRKKKILIIDDDMTYAQMIKVWLGKTYNVEIVLDGMQGISWLAKNETDLILLDYEMPVVDGPKVLEMLKMHSDTASIPVIFLTGIGTKESIARVKDLRPQGYILKSTTNAELNRTIGEFFKKHGNS